MKLLNLVCTSHTENHEKENFQLYVLAFAAIPLWNAASFFVRINVSPADVEQMENACKFYFRVHCLFLSVNLTARTVGYLLYIYLFIIVTLVQYLYK